HHHPDKMPVAKKRQERQSRRQQRGGKQYLRAQFAGDGTAQNAAGRMIEKWFHKTKMRGKLLPRFLRLNMRRNLLFGKEKLILPALCNTRTRFLKKISKPTGTSKPSPNAQNFPNPEGGFDRRRKKLHQRQY